MPATQVKAGFWKEFWNTYTEGLAIPLALLFRDATITIIALALITVILFIAKAFEAYGLSPSLTNNLETIHKVFTLIDAGILGIDTALKIGMLAFKRNKQ
jgi:hypothetical protein